MKASELAALLMQNPDMEVYQETCETPEFNDWYHKTDRITGVQITPSGVFIQSEFIPYEEECNIKSPSKIPVLDSIKVYLNNDEIFPVSQGYEDETIYGYGFFQDMTNFGSVYGYDDGCHQHLKEVVTEEESQDMTEVYFSTKDIKNISVLISIDEQWEPTYTNMSYEEAKKYFVEKYNIVKEETE